MSPGNRTQQDLILSRFFNFFKCKFYLNSIINTWVENMNSTFTLWYDRYLSWTKQVWTWDTFVIQENFFVYVCPLDALQTLVGQQNARYGIIKIFNALQESSANKHLLYVSVQSLQPNLYCSVLSHLHLPLSFLLNAFTSMKIGPLWKYLHLAPFRNWGLVFSITLEV